MDERMEAMAEERKKFYGTVKEFITRNGSTAALEAVIWALAESHAGSGVKKAEYSGPNFKLTLNLQKILFLQSVAHSEAQKQP